MKFFIERYTSHKVGDNPLWLVVLADIMTNLMLFFLILYVFTTRPDLASNSEFLEGFDKDTARQQKEKKAEDVVVLDVRREEEHSAEHIDGAVNIPIHELQKRLDEIGRVQLSEAGTQAG